jgi:hypothetical protein
MAEKETKCRRNEMASRKSEIESSENGGVIGGSANESWRLNGVSKI